MAKPKVVEAVLHWMSLVMAVVIMGIIGASGYAMWVDWKAAEETEGEIQQVLLAIENEERARNVVETAKKVKMKLLPDELLFLEKVDLRYRDEAKRMGISLKSISPPQKGKGSGGVIHALAFEAEMKKALEFVYRLRTLEPPSKPVKIRVNPNFSRAVQGEMGATVTASFETKGREWPENPNDPQNDPKLPPEVWKVLVTATEVFRDPTKVVSTGFATKEIKERDRWELVGYTDSSGQGYQIIVEQKNRPADTKGSEAPKVLYLKHKDKLMGWIVDLTQLEKGKSIVLLRRGKSEVSLKNGDVFNGEEVEGEKTRP